MGNLSDTAVLAWEAIQNGTLPENKTISGEFTKVNVNNAAEMLK